MVELIFKAGACGSVLNGCYMLKKNNVTGIVNIWEKESFNSISGPL
jgi:hypothetical protein